MSSGPSGYIFTVLIQFEFYPTNQSGDLKTISPPMFLEFDLVFYIIFKFGPGQSHRISVIFRKPAAFLNPALSSLRYMIGWIDKKNGCWCDISSSNVIQSSSSGKFLMVSSRVADSIVHPRYPGYEGNIFYLILSKPLQRRRRREKNGRRVGRVVGP
jgi:hypothetical protein